MAAWRSTLRGTIARSYGSKSVDLPIRTIGLNSRSLPKRRAHAPNFIVNKRLISTNAPVDTSELPDHLRMLSKDSKLISAAVRGLNEGYVVLMPPNTTTQFYKLENCQCPKCVHPDTKQRIVEIGSVLPDITPTKLDCGNLKEGAQITWNDGHESVYPWAWLERHNVFKQNLKYKVSVYGDGRPRDYRIFNAKTDSYPEVEFEKVMFNDASVKDWLEKIQTLGFCFIKGVPIDPEATKALIERIAFVRHTHYGGFWDFTADLTFKDTAYTNESLGVHTDNTYFTDPARLQLFHLLSHTDGSGGESLLVDGLAAASTLLKKHPEHYRTLIQVRQPWHASGNEDVCIQPSSMAPVFSIHPDRGRLYQIRWNNYDRAPKSDWPLETQKQWYEAAQCYDDILNERRRRIQTQLQPGTALIFDNWRMMHGRTEFTGKRRMCGGYVNNDDYISRLRLLSYGREEVLNNLGSQNHPDAKNGPYSII
ncbi:Trimethyllysine dioxygenase [Penicillium cosmopolitanum]|uniref:trimethyllysine dioxygenase n=1 Tax=Penicillium cosmopolitanum TaxID=1131564 RepID=A0A9W9W8V3_9EURO|nr:Trimethyllysine dioxygenase [Penicillium cosmopolitanum]KAJ5408457.1 Trimethyllysine dioxygenase [Penicillium cosmopolitanum]